MQRMPKQSGMGIGEFTYVHRSSGKMTAGVDLECVCRCNDAEPMRSLVHTLCCAVLAVSGLGNPCAAQQVVDERAAKAVLILHLTQFVTWPEPPPGNEFRVGILGPDPFGDVLESVLNGERVGSYPIVIKRGTAARALTDCQVVYVSPAVRESPARIQATFQGRAILTVGEREDFIRTGGVLRFTRTPASNLRLSINLDNARAAGLQISAQLLRVSDVHEEGAR